MRVGGVVGLSTAANVFVGMVEAPLFVRPYLARVSRGELFAIMAGGMASIAGTVLFLYGSILGRVMPDAVAHLLIASILSAPAALVVAFLMVPPGVTAGGDAGAEVRSRRQHGRADARHARRRAAPAQHRRHAGGVRRAGCARQPRSSPPIRCRARSAGCSRRSPGSRAFRGRSARCRRAARHQDGHQRAGGLSGSFANEPNSRNAAACS